MRKKEYAGIVLVVSGWVVQAVSLANAFDGVFVATGIATCAIGLGVYAASRGRSLAWSLLALMVALGPIIGLLLLAVFPRKASDAPEAKKPQTRTDQLYLRWGVLAYAAGLAFVVLLAPSGLWRRFFSDERSWALSVLADGQEALMFLIMVVLILAGAFLHLLGRTRTSPGWRVAAPWLLARAVLLGLVVAVGYGCIRTFHDAERIGDVLVDRSLSQLQPGMPRALVNTILLQANASMLPDSGTRLSARDKSRNEVVRKALESATEGNLASLGEARFHQIFFNVNKGSPSKKGPKHREVFVRTCCTMMFQWTRYDLFIEYDEDDRLRSARYLKSHHGDGQDSDCRVRLEIPVATGKRYPYACPPGVQDF